MGTKRIKYTIKLNFFRHSYYKYYDYDYLYHLL